MTNQKYPSLTARFMRLPGFLDFENTVKPMLDKAGISEDTFEFDCQSDPDTIPLVRLQVYANILKCRVLDLRSSAIRQY